MCLLGMFASASRRSLPLHQTLLDLFEGGKQTWPFTRTSKNSLLFYFFSFLDFGNTEIIQTYGTFNYNCTSVVQNNHNLPTFYQFSPKHREFSSIAVGIPVRTFVLPVRDEGPGFSGGFSVKMCGPPPWGRVGRK